MKFKNRGNKIFEVYIKDEKKGFSDWAMGVQKLAGKEDGGNDNAYKVWVRRYLLQEQGFKVMERQNKALDGNQEEISRYMRLTATERMEMTFNFQYIDLNLIPKALFHCHCRD